MNTFDLFLKKLARRASKRQAFNPYKDEQLLRNLRCYLEYMYHLGSNPIMLVGEAPGYRGCRLTGLPFSSCDLVLHSDHQLYRDLRDKLIVEDDTSEVSAQIIWNYFKDKHITPLFWNAFPFHPYVKYKLHTNRAPSVKEIQEGSWYLKELIELFKPKMIVAVGRKGELALQGLELPMEIEYVRHPSFGGKKAFMSGMDTILEKRDDSYA